MSLTDFLDAPDPAADARSGDPAQIGDIHFELLDGLFRATDPDARAHIFARLVLDVFEDYYARSRRIPCLAKAAFEARDWPATVRLSRYRLTLYAAYLDHLAPLLRTGLPEAATDEGLWNAAEAHLLAAIAHRYEADFAFAFWHSLRRKLFENEWRPVAYASAGADAVRCIAEPVLVTFSATLPIAPEVVREIMDMAGFAAPWADAAGDARRAAEVIAAALARLDPRDGEPVRIEMANSGFFRNRGACLVGRICLRAGAAVGRREVPLMLALLNDNDGIFIDAVLCEGDELQYAFSSTLANFHATSPYYHELAQFLSELMPKRPLGLHYSTIGYHHLGKVAVMKEMVADHRATGETFDAAPGFRGTVAIGFTTPSSRYVLKIIRDRPTEGYKWGQFGGLKSVLDKYRLVHEMDRAGSMLDNIIYTNVKLDRAMFAQDTARSVEGPRLADLDIMASTEGAPIPRVYGRARLAGQVIWATRLEEVVSTRTETTGGGGGGKGGLGGGGGGGTVTTTTTTYSYYANFAVGLCEGEIGHVGRIWANGALLDLAGLNVRVHRGSEDQAPDGLIVAKEGAADAPAYRGLAYVVFERLALAPFGNRIPQLSFEIVRPIRSL